MTRQRDEQGRFLPGHSISKGHGRPPKEREEKYLERFKKAVTLGGFEEATSAVLERAKEGDVNAWKALVEYAIGKPVTKVDARIDQRSVNFDLQATLVKIYGEEESDG